VLRLGNYLTKKKSEEEQGEKQPWAVRLGTYLEERRPAPWSIIANEKPKDPLALRLGTFLNETKPLGNLGIRKDDSAAAAEGSDPLVLRLGNYLNGGPGDSSGTAAGQPDEALQAAPVTADSTPPLPPPPPLPSSVEPAAAQATPEPAVAESATEVADAVPPTPTPSDPPPAIAATA